MKNVIVCYKWVLDEQDIKINSVSLALDKSIAKRKISDYDRNALEEGVKIAAEKEFSISTLTYGTTDAKKSLKDVLSRGSEKAYWVNDLSAEGADDNIFAKVLTSALKKIGEYDVILCGEGAPDTYSQQVGARIGALLDIPVITFASKIEIEDDGVKVFRKLGDSIEVVKAGFPVLISVLPEINKPRIPSMKEVMRASKKHVMEFSLADIGVDSATLQPKTKVESILGYKMFRKNILYKQGNLNENVMTIVKELQKNGVL